jgi:hypothetical protein
MNIGSTPSRIAVTMASSAGLVYERIPDEGTDRAEVEYNDNGN